MKTADLESTVASLLAPGRGILAADESLRTIEKRFAAAGVPPTRDNRAAYREMLFTTPGLSESISGVILFDETMRRQTPQGVPLPEVLATRGLIAGIKVDVGTVELPKFAGEKITAGFDGLRERLSEYRSFGARFTKWRAVITIGEGLPTHVCIASNARALALFAAMSQEAGLVPIVEPEVLMDGDHTLARCEEVTTATLDGVFEALFDHRVVLERTILKTGMLLPGSTCSKQDEDDVIAETTLRCLRRTVPAAVPGVVFLSGGQSEIDATRRLNAICSGGGTPWKLTYSFGRALQESALHLWRGSESNERAAQAAFRERARLNSAATRGEYSPALEEVNR